MSEPNQRRRKAEVGKQVCGSALITEMHSKYSQTQSLQCLFLSDPGSTLDDPTYGLLHGANADCCLCHVARLPVWTLCWKQNKIHIIKNLLLCHVTNLPDSFVLKVKTTNIWKWMLRLWHVIHLPVSCYTPPRVIFVLKVKIIFI